MATVDTSKLNVKVSADDTEFKDAFESMRDFAQKTYKRVQEAEASWLDESSNKIQEATNNWKAWLAGAFAISSIVGYTNSLKDTTIEINKADTAAKQFGVTLKDFQNYTFNLRALGIGDDKSLFFLEESAKRLGELQLGLGDVTSTLKKLGIDTSQFKGLDAVAGLQKLLEITKDLDQNQRTKILDAWADGLAAVMPLLDTASGKFQLINKDLNALGLGLGQRQIDDAKEYAKQITILGSIWDAFKWQVAANLAGPLADIVKSMIQSIKDAGGIRAAAYTIADSILTGVAYFLDALAKLSELVKDLAYVIRNPGKALVGQVNKGLIESVRNAPLGKSIFKKEIADYDEQQASSSSSGIVGAINTGKNDILSLRDQFRKDLEALPVREFSASVAEMVKVFYTVKNPTKALVDEIEAVPNLVKKLTNKAADSVSEGLVKTFIKERESAIDLATKIAEKSALKLSEVYANTMRTLIDVGRSVGEDGGLKSLNYFLKQNKADVDAFKASTDRMRMARDILNPRVSGYLEESAKRGNPNYDPKNPNPQQAYSETFDTGVRDVLTMLTKKDVDKDALSNKLDYLKFVAENTSLTKKGAGFWDKPTQLTNSGMLSAVSDLQEKFLERLNKEKPVKLAIEIELRTPNGSDGDVEVKSANADIVSQQLMKSISDEAKRVNR